MITLKEITWENLSKVIDLKPNADQGNYLPSNAVFMAQAYVNLKFKYPDACFAICNDVEAVGFTKIVYVPKGAAPYDFLENTYMIDAIMIDSKHQGKGYGKQALEKVLNYIESKPFGDYAAIKLLCYDENVLASAIYLKAGFIRTDRFKNDDEKTRIYEKRNDYYV